MNLRIEKIVLGAMELEWEVYPVSPVTIPGGTMKPVDCAIQRVSDVLILILRFFSIENIRIISGVICKFSFFQFSILKKVGK